MGLGVPDLDDLTFEELVESAQRSIPVHDEAWTDHNASDPGITILETLAWVAESDVYRLDRVTDDHLRKYLQLLGGRPRPPRPASTHLVLAPDEDAVGRTIRSGARLDAESGTDEVVPFTTAANVTLTDASVTAVLTRDRSGVTDDTNANATAEMYYHAFGPEAAWGSELYVGFDEDPFAEADWLDLFVDFHEANLPEPSTHGTAGRDRGTIDPVGPGGIVDERPPADFEGSGDDGSSDGSSVADAPGEFDPSVELEWEHCLDLSAWSSDGVWKPVEAVEDGTNRLYRGGTIGLAAPDDWQGDDGTVLDVEGSRYWLRCAVRTPGYEVPPQVTEIRTNVVRARHRAERIDETLTTPDGDAVTTAEPDQRFVFERAPVLDATVHVGGQRWTAVPDFAASGPGDRHYVLDRAEGAIRFGDGVRGAVPPAGLPVVARRYVHGGGADGNGFGSASWRFAEDELDGAGVGVAPRSRASGGEDAESLVAALARLKRDLKRPYRLVTPEDCEYVAEHTPGLRFGRATVRVDDVGVDDDGDCGARGDLRVVVVPYSTRPRPEPSDGFLDAVRRHLERHRLLTDQVTVVPPAYVGVGVEAVVELESGFSERRRIDAVEAALDDFLDPLSGFDGDGWPFGRPVFPSELYRTIGTVQGVDCVHDVAVTATGEYEFDDGAVVVPDAALVYPLDHAVRVGTAGDRCRRWD